MYPEQDQFHFIEQVSKAKREFFSSQRFNEEVLRQYGFIPIRPLGHGSFGRENSIISTKIIPSEKFDLFEWNSADILWKVNKTCPFILDYIRHYYQGSHFIILTAFANMKTLNIIAKQPRIALPSNIFRALFKQILVGMQVFHAAGLAHRDIKCDNILLHSPPGSGRVYAKISDFGFSNKENSKSTNQYFRGTVPYMAPEILMKPPVGTTQKVDIFALGITVLRLLTHKYPFNLTKTNEYRQKYKEIKMIERPAEVTDNLLWNLLTQMLEFDPINRITASDALDHPYFTSNASKADVSPQQQYLSDKARAKGLNKEQNITEFDMDPTFIVPEPDIQLFLQQEMLHIQKFKDSYLCKDGELPFASSSQLIQESIISLPTTTKTSSQINSTVPESPYSDSKQELTDEFESIYEVYGQNICNKQQQEYQYNYNQSIDFSAQIYQSTTGYIEQESRQLASISFIATPEQLLVEKQLSELNFPIELINVQLDKFDGLTLQEKEVMCANLISHLNKDRHTQIKAQQLGIIDKIMMIINQHTVEQIYRIYFEVPLVIINIGIESELVREQMLQIMNKMKQCLNRPSNDDQFFVSIGNIFRYILAYGHKVDNGQQNPIRGEFERDGTVKQLVRIFRDNRHQDERIRQFAAVGIGGLYKGVQCPDDFGPEIIRFLIQQSNPENPYPCSRSILALAWMAECQDNHKYILEDGFLEKQNMELDEKRKNFLFYRLQLLNNIFIHGSDETKQQMIQQKLIDCLQQHLETTNVDVLSQALKLNELLNDKKTQIQ
ncbi:MAG: hypothetical protein EZS28_015658 [Streblomastix strix]|uniref:Protein kinase domain-containing protein n=1 Tax=Streblomastix strix TaxID=222440 RepID=A0A5J4W1I2_9EUKA|nr:MAG: hypothetical protein EZS28_015658 [Streblomastix strix]